MKGVMISIERPHTDNIKALIKTIDVRKNKPNTQNPFPCFIYETKAKGGCGKVIGEFVCDKIYNFVQFGAGIMFADNELNQLEPQLARDMTCLTDKQIEDYLGNKDGYGWHISDLKIYDEPKELSEFHKIRYGILDCFTGCDIEAKSQYGCCRYFLKRPPQSWGYVEV